MKKYLPGPAPYEPEKAVHMEESEPGIKYFEGKRKGQMDLKCQALKRDGYKCRYCGKYVTAITSNADHIKPVKSFAGFEQANYIDNIQTLCIECHKQKTYS